MPPTVTRLPLPLLGLGLGLLLPLLAGCSAWSTHAGGLREPDVSLAGLSLKDPNPLRPTFRVRLRVDNPNDLDIRLDGADVDLALNGQPVATGVSRSPLILKKLATSEMTVDLTADTLGAVRQLLTLRSRPALDYRVTGDMIWHDGFGPFGRLPLSFGGSVDRATLLRAAGSLAE